MRVQFINADKAGSVHAVRVPGRSLYKLVIKSHKNRTIQNLGVHSNAELIRDKGREIAASVVIPFIDAID